LRLFVAHRDWRHRYLKHGDPLTPTRLCFNPRRHDPFSSFCEHHNITGLKVRRWVLQQAEVVSGCVVEAVDRHSRSIGGWHEFDHPRSRSGRRLRSSSASRAVSVALWVADWKLEAAGANTFASY
jgi:hypothetical protein